MIVVAALPVATALPPICELALNAARSCVRVIVPVLNKSELAFNVKVPLPAFMVMLPPSAAETLVLACTVMPLVSVMETWPPPLLLTPVVVRCVE